MLKPYRDSNYYGISVPTLLHPLGVTGKYIHHHDSYIIWSAIVNRERKKSHMEGIVSDNRKEGCKNAKNKGKYGKSNVCCRKSTEENRNTGDKEKVRNLTQE